MVPPQSLISAQQSGKLCLFVRLKRSWLGTKVHKGVSWDRGKSESDVTDSGMNFPFHNCIGHHTALTKEHFAVLLLRHKNMHIGKQSGTYCPFKEIIHFLLLFSQTEALFFPFSEAAFQCSEVWLLVVSGAELQYTNHSLGLEQHSVQFWNPILNILIVWFYNYVDRQRLNKEISKY